MRLHRLRVQVVMAAWVIPDAVDFVRALPRRRVLALTAVAVAILTPTVLFFNERARRIEMSRAYGQLALASASEISTLRHTMGNLLSEQAELKQVLLEAGYAVYSDNDLSVPVLVTGYSSSVWETDSTPFITAANTRTRHGIVALSRDLLQRYNPDAPFAFGDVVHISGLGDFIVEDSMNARWRRRVDVWFPSHDAAIEFGRRRGVLRATVRRHADDGEGDETAYQYTLPLNLAASAGGSP
jgi:3D (Asp-Asp-Asp) domain-containing protein